MRPGVATCALLAGVVAAQSSQDAQTTSNAAEAEVLAAQELLMSMPACGRACLQEARASSPCAPTDIACSCGNETLQAEVQVCVAQTCTLKESLTTKNTSVTLCQRPVRDRTTTVVLVAMIGFGIAAAAVVLRMISRAVGQGTFWENSGFDDAVIILAMVLVGGISSCSVVLTDNGLGRDLWTVPFESITTLLHVFWVNEILYIIGLPLIKISIVLTYMRVFQEKSFKWLAYAVIALNVAYMIAFTVVTVAQCSPISYAWTKWDGEHHGSCMNVNAQIIAAAAGNIVLDVVVVAMPMPYLWRLQMNLKKKVMVMFMFSGGLFVVVVSCLRLKFLISFGEHENLTWEYTDAGDWSVVEMDASVLCACMPGIRRLLKTLWPRMWATTSRSNVRSAAEPPYRSGLSNGAIDLGDQKRPAVRSSFIPLDDMDSRERHNHFEEYYRRPEDSTSTLVGGAIQPGTAH